MMRHGRRRIIHCCAILAPYGYLVEDYSSRARGTPVRTRLGIPTILPDSGYPIDSEMGMGPDWAHGIFGGIPVAHGRMVGAGYFTYPRGSNFNGVVTTKLLAFFSRLVALQGASLFHQVRPRARRNLLEHELAGAGSGSHIMCVHQLRLKSR